MSEATRRDGTEASLGQAGLVARYRDPLIRYFARRGFPTPLAEDLAHDTFTRLFSLADQSRIQNVEAYLFQIAASVFADHLRRARTRREAHHIPLDATEPLAEVLGPDRVFEGKEAFARVKAALSELPPKTCEIFLLNRMDGLTYTQIAVRFGVSTSAIEKQMVKALAYLHMRVEEKE
jgi:RNA polymerase sigma factor (sigma-70 family)